MSATSTLSRKILNVIKQLERGKNNEILNSAFLGLPQQLYSHNLSENIKIGNESYYGFTQFLKNQMNTSEYSQPSSPKTSMSEIFEKYKSFNPKAEEFSEELLMELETLNNLKNELLTNQDHDSDMLHTENSPIFKHIPARDFKKAGHFKSSFMLQHPMSVHDLCSFPAVLLGLEACSQWEESPITGDWIEAPSYSSIKLNDKSLMDVRYVTKRSDSERTKDENYIKTTHGKLIIPELFHQEPLYFGGDNINTTEVITTSKFCKGVPIMGAKLFWNPDLKAAKKMIEAGHAEMRQFRFFQGKMTWNEQLFENMIERNVYSAFVAKSNLKAHVIPQMIDSFWNDDEDGSQCWIDILRQAPDEWEIWIGLQKLMKVSENLKALKEMHRKNVCRQIEHWQCKDK